MRRLTRAGLAAGLAATLAGAGAAAAEPADLILWGGPIWTGVDAHPKAQAVAISHGRIAYVGTRAGAARLRTARTELLDLHGAALFPGFTDSHAHLDGIGERELTLNLEGAKSAAEATERLRAYAAALPPGEPVIGLGWIETGWPEHRFLQASDLDAAAPGRRVFLERADGHAVVVNSAVLAAAKVDATTHDPPGGHIERDAQGRPTGLFVDNAKGLVDRLRPATDETWLRRRLQAAFKVEARYGWTGAHFMSTPWAAVALMERMDREGAVPIRVYDAVIAHDAGPLLKDGPRQTADGRVTTRAIKAFADGALGSRGAALLAPYSDAPGSTGLLVTPPDQLAALYAKARAAGLQVATHAIGDRAVREVLDLYAAAGAGPADRWRIEHAQNVTWEDQPRFAKLGVIASMQPSHAISDLHFVPARLGSARLTYAYPWKSLRDRGAVVAGGSDAPVERGDPAIEFYAAVARKDLKGFSNADWHREQRLSRAEALKLFTSAAAYARFAETELGTIEVGKRADLTAFDRDLMTVPEAELPKAKAVLTLVDGQAVFRAPGF